jgi:hypothetical protein
MEWPRIQIPQSILSNLLDKTLKDSFITDTRAREEHHLTFYERNY